MAVKKKTVKESFKNMSAKTSDELRVELVSTQTDLVEARRSHASRELSNTAHIKELRKRIARINTALGQAKEENK